MAKAKVAAKSIKDLVGKQVKLRPHHSDNTEGPFTLIGFDPPYLGLNLNGEDFWWHTDIIEGIREDVPSETE